MLFVTHVDQYAPDDECASVTLQSENGEIVVFCWPCTLKVGDRVENRLSALDAVVQAACLSDWPEEEKERLSEERLIRQSELGPYAYCGCGRVLDQDDGLIEVLGFHIDVGELPCEGGC